MKHSPCRAHLSYLVLTALVHQMKESGEAGRYLAVGLALAYAQCPLWRTLRLNGSASPRHRVDGSGTSGVCALRVSATGAHSRSH